MSNRPSERSRGLTIVTFAYLSAALAAWAIVRLLPGDLHPLWVAAGADVGATVVVFGWSVANDNSSVYDPYWSVAPLMIAPWLALHPQAVDAVGMRQALVLGFVSAWGLRLTYSWARGWPGMHHEDWRYADLRRTSGRFYWVVSFLGLHLMPTLMVFAGCLALWPALVVGAAPLGWLDGVGVLLCTIAIACEALADRQLHEFRGTSPPPGTILQQGLWGWSRHPNYFGEITLWWGLLAFALAAAPGMWWPVAGPVAITLLFTFISIPMIEKRMHARRKGWPEHCRRVSVLVPWPPRRAAR